MVCVITLPSCFAAGLQLRVFLAFLDSQQHVFVDVFFDSGVATSLMHALTIDVDFSDDLICLDLMVLERLAMDVHHKDLLCARGLIGKLVECITTGLHWDTLKSAGRLFVELFRGNVKHQAEICKALQGLMALKFHPTQCIALQTLISIFIREGHTAILQDAARQSSIMDSAVSLLDSEDLKVKADSYCLVCHMLQICNCDRVLHGFSRAELTIELNRADEWLRLEIPGDETQRARGPEDFGHAFHSDAAGALRWGLLLLLARRDEGLCLEFVNSGLTETILVCLLERYPVRLDVAAAELHRLQFLSPRAQRVVQEVLGDVTVPELLDGCDTDFLRTAQQRLRNLLSSERRAFSAAELCQKQDLLERLMLETLDMAPLPSPFLTDIDVPPHRPGTAESDQGGTSEETTICDVDIPFGDVLASLMFDPLTLKDGDTSLSRELQPSFPEVLDGECGSSHADCDAAVRTRGKTLVGSDVQCRERAHSHRPSSGHNRALALRGLCGGSSCMTPRRQTVGADAVRQQHVGNTAMAVTERSSRRQKSQSCTSMQDTTVEESSEELSLLFTEPSFVAVESMDALDRHMSQWTQKSLEDAKVIERSTTEAVVQVLHGDETDALQGHILHVEAPPCHDCLAFDKMQQERDRSHAAKQVLRRFLPETQQLFQGLQEAGTFPRRTLRGTGRNVSLDVSESCGGRIPFLARSDVLPCA